MKELGDRAAQGRAYGNLGNTQYLLGNFTEAIAFHKEVGNCFRFFWGWVPGREQPCFLLTTSQEILGGVLPPCLFYSLLCVLQILPVLCGASSC